MTQRITSEHAGSQWYLEGKQARREGKPMNANPYAGDAAKARSWERGWILEDWRLRNG